MRQEKRRSPSEIVKFYKQQLRKFKILGIGKKTEWDVVVTPSLIEITQKRLQQLVIKKIEL